MKLTDQQVDSSLFQKGGKATERPRDLPHDTEIAVIGAGMAGLTAALALADLGLQVSLFDEAELPSLAPIYEARLESPFSNRVSALTLASRNLLTRLGVWQAVEKVRVEAYLQMRVWDALGNGSIHFSADEVQADALGYLVENNIIVAALAERARSMPNVCIRSDNRLQDIQRDEDKKLVLTFSKKTGEYVKFRSTLVVAADGVNSRVRACMDFKTRSWSYGQNALVCTVRCSKRHNHTAWQVFLPTGPLALLPLHRPGDKSDNCCSIVWSCDTALSEELINLSSAGLAFRIQQAVENCLGEIEVLDTPAIFPLLQQHAIDYVQEGVVLVGDAAHSIHPLAGQGINLGFADVACLQHTLDEAKKNNRELNSIRVLSSYQRRRKPENLGMMALMEGFKRVFSTSDFSSSMDLEVQSRGILSNFLTRFAPTMIYLRNLGLRSTNQLIPIKHRLLRLMLKDS